MFESLAQQFLGGGAESMGGEQLHGHVGQMVQNAPNDTVESAIGTALGALGPQGFSQSVGEAAHNTGPQGHQALANVLLQAVEQGGGNRHQVASQYGVGGGGGFSAGKLAGLAMHVAETHPQVLAQVLGNHANNNPTGQGSVMQLLGNPMVRQIGMQLVQKML